MIKSKKIFWFLQIEETKNLRFCQRYFNTNELNLENNKRIIDKLADENIEKICWIGDEAVNYPYFIKLLKYAKEKNIQCELLFFSDINIMKAKNFINEIDTVILTRNTRFDIFNYEFEKLLEFKKILSDKTKLNILTMVNSQNIDYSDNILERIRLLGIDTWIILSYMPILLNLEDDVKSLNISKIRFRDFSPSIVSFFDEIEHCIEISEYTISRKYKIILPNGDIAIMNEKDSILIGNILENTMERIEKNFNNKRKKIIPKKSEQKIEIFIGCNNEKTNKKIIKELEPLKYVDIVGISKNGKDSYEEIINKKPEMVFLQYNFEDISGFELIKMITQKLKLEAPVVNVLEAEPLDDELRKLIEEPYIQMNALLGNGRYYKGRVFDIVQQYKEYRDKD